jgi:hypothetical protein
MQLPIQQPDGTLKQYNVPEIKTNDGPMDEAPGQEASE